MRTYDEIYGLFLNLIKGKIKKIKLSFAEIEMLNTKRFSYVFFGTGYYINGSYNIPADVLRKLCQENGITQMLDFKDNCFIYFKDIEKRR